MLIQFTNVRSLLARSSSIAGACLVLAACRGGSSLPPGVSGMSDSAVSASHSMSQHAGIPVTVDQVVPVGKAALRRNLGERNPFFVAFGTKGAKVVAFAHGDRTTPLGTVVANVAAGSSVCTQGAARVCALALSVHGTGKDDFVITTYDQSPSGGVIPPGAPVGCRRGRGKDRVERQDVERGGRRGSRQYLALSVTRCGLEHRRHEFSAIVVARDADGNAIVTEQVRERKRTEAGIKVSAELERERRHVLSIQSVRYQNRGKGAGGDGKR